MAIAGSTVSATELGVPGHCETWDPWQAPPSVCSAQAWSTPGGQGRTWWPTCADRAHFPNRTAFRFCCYKYHSLATLLIKWQLHTIWDHLRGLQMNLDSTACSQELPTIATRSQSSPNTNQLIRHVDYLGLPTSAWWGDTLLSSPWTWFVCPHGPWGPRANPPPGSAECNTHLHPRSDGGSLRRPLGGTGEVLQLTLNVITYPTASTDSYEYPLCARHLPELQDKY